MNKKPINVLSLFDGISCAREALKRVGFKNVKYYASEVDKYAIQISQKNYPDIIQLGDVVKLRNNNKLLKQLGKVDLLIGGSPCQDLSIAKKNRKGLDGSRSGLFWEYVKILKKIKPKYFVLENVNSMSKESKAIITKALGVEPIMINAALVSAQNRKRLFWTNIPNVLLPLDRGILLKDILEKNVGEEYHIKGNYKGFIKINPEKAKGLLARDYANWSGNMIRIGEFNKGGQGDRIYSPEGKSVGLSALGGGRGAKTGLYAIAVASRGRNLINGKRKDIFGAKTKQRMEFGGEKSNTLTKVQKDSYVLVKEATKKGFAVVKDGDSIDLSFPNSKTRRGRVGNKVKNIMTSQNIGVFTKGIIRKLTPIECERLQGLPDNYTGGGISDSQRYKCLGNAFNTDVVAHILKQLSTS